MIFLLLSQIEYVPCDAGTIQMLLRQRGNLPSCHSALDAESIKIAPPKANQTALESRFWSEAEVRLWRARYSKQLKTQNTKLKTAKILLPDALISTRYRLNTVFFLTLYFFSLAFSLLLCYFTFVKT
jgi:hypothetical protein